LPVSGDTSGPTVAADCGAHGRLAADGKSCDCDDGWEPQPDALTGSEACNSPVLVQPAMSSNGTNSSSNSSVVGGDGSVGAAIASPTGKVQMILFVVGGVGCVGLVTVAICVRRRRLRARREAGKALGARRAAASSAAPSGGSFDPRSHHARFDPLNLSFGQPLSPAQMTAFAAALSETQGSSLRGEATSSQLLLDALRYAASSSTTDGPAGTTTADELVLQLERIELHLRGVAQATQLKSHARDSTACSDLDSVSKAEMGAARYARAVAKQP
jgi:hypothetical protein